ncbi:MAG: YbhB/YbcL family Raf kinase inhibitor-like protein [Spirochaetes bacterium]|nr:YbhB/YbcL family Raf kinase inhibitor-like protein [Spirochaetota bacterium]
MKISSKSFPNGGFIPPKFAMKAIAGGQNISPHILIEEIPANTQSLAIAMVDRHPIARNWVHWMVANIPPSAAEIQEGASGKMPKGSVELENTFGFEGYGGPQPPKGSGVHSYEITVYCLSEIIAPKIRRPSEKEFLSMIEGKILAKAKIIGNFENK